MWADLLSARGGRYASPRTPPRSAICIKMQALGSSSSWLGGTHPGLCAIQKDPVTELPGVQGTIFLCNSKILEAVLTIQNGLDYINCRNNPTVKHQQLKMMLETCVYWHQRMPTKNVLKLKKQVAK